MKEIDLEVELEECHPEGFRMVESHGVILIQCCNSKCGNSVSGRSQDQVFKAWDTLVELQDD